MESMDHATRKARLHRSYSRGGAGTNYKGHGYGAKKKAQIDNAHTNPWGTYITD